MNVKEQIKLLPINIKAQIQKLLPTLIAIYFPAICLAVGLVIVHLMTDLNISYLTRDPYTVIDNLAEDFFLQQSPLPSKKFVVPFYIGIVSNLGILLWYTAAVISFFTYILLRKNPKRKLPASFFFESAAFSTILFFDDLFLLHEQAIPDYLGIDELIVFAGYGLLILTYLLRWWRWLLRTDYLLLLIALTLFSLSILIDISPISFSKEKDNFLEDMCKFFGILSWSAYYIRVCFVQSIAVTFSPSLNKLENAPDRNNH